MLQRGPRQFDSLENPIDVATYAPLSRYKVWTNDSQDELWRANHQDFVGNSFDEDNCDFMLLADEDEWLLVDKSLDLERYKEFAHLSRDQKVAIEYIRRERWGQAQSRLLGD